MKQGAFIGVDCGGTSCRIAWTDGARRVDYIGRGANYTTDPEGCATAIVEAAERLADKAGQSLGEICGARSYLGVAGIVTEAQADDLARALPFDAPLIEDDRRALVRGALSDADGYLASIGTGSFFARQTNGEITGIGGWGLTLGDEASGAWLGRGLLRLTLHAKDGIVPRTALTDAVLDEMGGAAAIVDFASDARPNEYARLAPGLAGAAEAGDPQGRVLMKAGADWVARAVRALGWTPGDGFCLPGSLGAYYVPYLPPDMQAAIVPQKGSAIDGALALARASAPDGLSRDA